jgi:hypothetical protein
VSLNLQLGATKLAQTVLDRVIQPDAYSVNAYRVFQP